MLGISFGSIGTGLPKDIVQQLLAAEKIPMEKMNARKANIEEKKKLVVELTRLVDDINSWIRSNSDEKAFRELKTNARDDIVGVTVDKNVADTGNHQLEVLELAQKSSAMSTGFEDKDESYLGVGFIQYTLPSGDKHEIYVDESHSSLSGVAKLINTDPNSGMKASVVNDGSGSDSPWHLMISLTNTGADSNAEFPYFYFVDGIDDFSLEQERNAKNARVKLDGFEVEVPENKVKDLIPGVTLDLKKAAPGEEFTIGVTEDISAVTKKFTDIIEKINKLLKFIKDQNTLDEKSDTSKTLGGDILLQTLESRVRSAVFQEVDTDWGPMRPSQIGISFQRDGLLKFDEKMFNAKISENYAAVSQILLGKYTVETGEIPGFFTHLGEFVKNALRSPDGVLPQRKQGLESTIHQIDRRVADKQRMLDQKEKMLKDKFARLEGTMSQLQKSSAGLAALGASGGSAVQQLG